MRVAASVRAVLSAMLMAASAPVIASPLLQSDAAIRQAVIRQSIAAYPGPCPCPYSVARNGDRCGGRSAWSRPGGASPICYPDDVTAAQIAARRRT